MLYLGWQEVRSEQSYVCVSKCSSKVQAEHSRLPWHNAEIYRVECPKKSGTFVCSHGHNYSKIYQKLRKLACLGKFIINATGLHQNFQYWWRNYWQFAWRDYIWRHKLDWRRLPWHFFWIYFSISSLQLLCVMISHWLTVLKHKMPRQILFLKAGLVW